MTESFDTSEDFHLLIVDDDEVDRMAVGRALKQAELHLRLVEAIDCASALALLRKQPFDAVFIDYYLPDGTGFDLLNAIQQAGWTLPVIVLTGREDTKVAVELMKAGAADYLPKASISPENLLRSLRHAIRVYRAEQQTLQINQKLKQSEAKYRFLAESLPQIIWVARPDGTIEYCNQYWYTYTGLTEEQTVNCRSGWHSVIHPHDIHQFSHWRTVSTIHAPIELECRVREATTNTYRWHLIRAMPVQGAEKNIVKWIGTAIDIDDLKQVTQALRDSQELYRTLAETMDHLVWTLTPEGQFDYVNQKWRDALGLTPEQVNEKGWNIMVHPEDLPYILKDWSDIQTKGTTIQREYRHHMADGTYRWFLGRIAVVHNQQGQILRCIGTSTDIDERKRAEEAMRSSEERLALASQAARIGTWEWILPTNRIIWTGNQEALYGLHPGEFGGTFDYWVQLVHPEDQEKVKQDVLESLINKQELDIEFRVVWPDETIRWLAAKGRIFHDESGNPQRLIGINEDITDRKQADVERLQLLERERKAREDAEAANRIKDEFLTILSHELRSPLNPILGWARLLRSRKLNETKTAQALETIERNAKLQAELIEDLLDVSRILRGKLILNIMPVNLPPIIHAAIETVRLAAEAKSIDVRFTICQVRLDDDKEQSPTSNFQPSEFQVLGDSNRLQQIVWNLLSNAVKFTPEGGQIDLKLEHVEGRKAREWESGREREQENGKVGARESTEPALRFPSSVPTYARITVADTGKGIKPEFLPHVFDYFRQADSTITRKFGGLGLGLAIVRHLVELHGGTVHAASDGEGKGATFTVVLPLFHKHEQQTTTNNHSTDNLHHLISGTPLAGLNILVVDDDDDTREYIAFSLEQVGSNVLTAASANEAFNLLIKSKLDILLSDIGMPDIDGYSLMRRVRSLPSKREKDIPAIALTAYAGEINERQALEAGFQTHLTKPVEPVDLVKAIAKLVGKEL